MCPAEDNGRIQLLSIPANTLWTRMQHCSHQDQPIRSSQQELPPNNALNGLATDKQNSESEILGKTQRESNLHPELDPAGGQGLEHWDCSRTGWQLCGLCGALPWEGLCSEPRLWPLTLPWPAASRTQRCSTELILGGGRRNSYIAAAGMSCWVLSGVCSSSHWLENTEDTQAEEAQISGTMKHPTHH